MTAIRADDGDKDNDENIENEERRVSPSAPEGVQTPAGKRSVLRAGSPEEEGEEKEGDEDAKRRRGR